MLTNNEIVQSIVYLVSLRHDLSLSEVFQLLYHWDFLSFKQHGSSATGWKYIATLRGPYPAGLLEWKGYENVSDEFLSSLSRIPDNERGVVYIRAEDLGLLTDSESISHDRQPLLDAVVCRFNLTKDCRLIDEGLFGSSPWYDTLLQKGSYEEIEYAFENIRAGLTAEHDYSSARNTIPL